MFKLMEVLDKVSFDMMMIMREPKRDVRANLLAWPVLYRDNKWKKYLHSEGFPG